MAALCLAGCGSGSGDSGSGGVLRATFSSFPDYLDPAFSHSEEGWTAVYDTYVPLLTYRHAAGKAGSEVIPGLARSLPEISEGGLRVRRAVNYAVDPEALERIYAGQVVATQQVLPPGMPGYKHFELYPYNLGKAKKLIEEADPADRQITVWTDDERSQEEAGSYLVEVLKDIGFEVKLQVMNSDNYFAIVGNQSTSNLDIGWASWFQDYPHPNDFFQPMLTEESIFPTNTTNLARFADPQVSAKIAELAEQPMSPQVEAEYATLDREVMRQAPWVPYGTGTLGTFVSSAIDLDQVIYNPTFNQDLTSFRFK
ncbi:MAG TPA: ABC transporter substrate-binding protein [Solirubrobacterales bacterium]|nr:ABC transporter substrate-binding protein [Solirubrobacterales bacterium]